MKRFLAVLLELTVNIVLSIVFLTILSQAFSLQPYEQIVAGALFFLCSSAIWHRYALIGIARGATETVKDREDLLRAFDRVNFFEIINPRFQTIAENLKTLSGRYGNDDLFVKWYLRKIDLLQKHLKHTVDTEVFDFDQGMAAERSVILDLLRKRKPSFFWAIASCASISHFADPDGTAFLRQIDDRLQARQITAVRRLFLCDQISDLEDLSTRILLHLHEQNGYECKVINNNDIDTMFRNFGDKSMTKDFGIYGSSFVWETPEENILTQLGGMCRDQQRISKYKLLYEELWRLAKPCPVADKQIIDLCRGYRIYDFRTLLDSQMKIGANKQ